MLILRNVWIRKQAHLKKLKMNSKLNPKQAEGRKDMDKNRNQWNWKLKNRDQWNKKINNTDKPLAGIIQKRDKTQTWPITWMNEKASLDFADIRRIIRKNYKQLYVNILGIDDLREMKKITWKAHITNITQKEINNPNCPIPIFNWSGS